MHIFLWANGHVPAGSGRNGIGEAEEVDVSNLE